MTDAAGWKGKLVDPEGLRVYMPEEDVERKGVFADQVRTFKADTLEELAVKIGQDPATFVKTVRTTTHCAKRAPIRSSARIRST